MINFSAPYSVRECVTRLETSQSMGMSLTPYTKTDFKSSTATAAGFRFELWIYTLRLAYVAGSLARESDSSTRVQGIAIANSTIQLAVVALVAAAMLLTWQQLGGDQRTFLPFAVVFVLVGPGLSLLLRNRVESALRRALL